MRPKPRHYITIICQMISFFKSIYKNVCCRACPDMSFLFCFSLARPLSLPPLSPSLSANVGQLLALKPIMTHDTCI